MVAPRVNSAADNFAIQMEDLGPNKPEKCNKTFEGTVAPILPSLEITDGEFST